MFEDMSEMVKYTPHRDWADGINFARLLVLAKIEGGELYYILHWLRDVGCVLERNDRFGYVLKPVINDGAWSSQAEWDAEKQALVPYSEMLMKMLKEVAEHDEQRKQRAENVKLF